MNPLYECEACGAVQCENCLEKKDSIFNQSHPMIGDLSFKCDIKDTLVKIPRLHLP